MIDLDNLKEIWQTISRNKTRSLLTAFGVFWGIFILVLLSSAGNGIQNGLMKVLQGFATNSAFVFAQNTTVEYKGFPIGRNWDIKSSDIPILKSRIPQLEYVVPVINTWGEGEGYNMVYKGNHANFNIRGTIPEYNKINVSILLEGRYIDDMDLKMKRKVCVIGNRVAESLFGHEDPLNKLIKINGINFQVIGVAQALNEHIQIDGSSSSCVVIPFTTMQQMYNMGEEIHLLLISTDNTHSITDYTEEISAIIKSQHNISPIDEKAVNIINFHKEFQQFNKLFIGLNALIWIVGLGTLLSGIVGVSNIMLVTVKERTNEIGIRRALGAKPKQIARQIMSESLILTIASGLAGLCIATGIMILLSPTLANLNPDFGLINPFISFRSALTATIIIIISGAFAGWLPVKRALSIKAIDAIRDE